MAYGGDLSSPQPSLVTDWSLGSCQALHPIFWPSRPPQDSAKGSLILLCWASFILGVTLISLNHLPVSSLEPREKRNQGLTLARFLLPFLSCSFSLSISSGKERGLAASYLPPRTHSPSGTERQDSWLFCVDPVDFCSALGRWGWRSYSATGERDRGSALKMEQILSEARS